MLSLVILVLLLIENIGISFSLVNNVKENSLFNIANDYSDNVSFNFKNILIGNLSTLTVFIVSINKNTGEVIINGVDTKRPNIPFTFDWGDGLVHSGWFPQRHIYHDKNRNYIVKVTSHYSDGTIDTAQILVRFIPPSIKFNNTILFSRNVSIPDHNITLISRIPGYGVPKNLTYFDDSFFTLINRTIIEYILTIALLIQKNFANDNVYSVDGNLKVVVLRDPSFPGAYVLWYTHPMAIVVGDCLIRNGYVAWSSFFHELGHIITLNSPSNYFYGGKIDGPANAIFSETMAQIFQHATAYELVNYGEKYGLGKDIIFEIEDSAIQTMKLVRLSYEKYTSSGKKFSSWNDPTTPEDETFNTFMTIAYKFFLNAEKLGNYTSPLKKMMSLLQTFEEKDKERYGQFDNSPTANAFRSTLMIAALSYGFGKDLRSEFRELNFPIDDNIYDELLHRMEEVSPKTIIKLTKETITQTITKTKTIAPISVTTTSTLIMTTSITKTFTVITTIISTLKIKPDYTISIIIGIVLLVMGLMLGFVLRKFIHKE
jgi:hypothetical protein